MEYRAALEFLLARRSLELEQADSLFRAILDDSWSDVRVAAVLVALRAKGSAASELAGCARLLRERARPWNASLPGLVDTCGTGGGPPTFNISTGAAILAAACGARVAKHGNRAVTSACGSADVLEALGVRLDPDEATLRRLLTEVGIAFFFALAHHPALARIGPLRRELGVRTIFNQVGPLAHPAGADVQLIGVYEDDLLQPMAEALALLGTRRAWVVHGEDGLDEISPVGPTRVADLRDGKIKTLRVEPADFGLEPVEPSALRPGATVEESAAILREALTDADSPRSRCLIPSAAAALFLSGTASDLPTAARMACDAVRDGLAWRTLERLVEGSRA